VQLGTPLHDLPQAMFNDIALKMILCQQFVTMFLQSQHLFLLCGKELLKCLMLLHSNIHFID